MVGLRHQLKWISLHLWEILKQTSKPQDLYNKLWRQVISNKKTLSPSWQEWWMIMPKPLIIDLLSSVLSIDVVLISMSWLQPRNKWLKLSSCTHISKMEKFGEILKKNLRTQIWNQPATTDIGWKHALKNLVNRLKQLFMTNKYLQEKWDRKTKKNWIVISLQFVSRTN